MQKRIVKKQQVLMNGQEQTCDSCGGSIYEREVYISVDEEVYHEDCWDAICREEE